MGLPIAQPDPDYRYHHNPDQPGRDHTRCVDHGPGRECRYGAVGGYFPTDTRLDTTLFRQPRPISTMTDPSLIEASGLAPSRRNPGYQWTEEGSGNPNEIQLLRPNGTIAARFTIDGAVNRDWEDMAVGPGPVPGETYIYLADIGDNKLRYAEKVIYRFLESTISGQTLPYVGHVTNADAIRLTLPDGLRNAEAILIDPVSLDLFIFSKGDRSELYRAGSPPVADAGHAPEPAASISL